MWTSSLLTPFTLQCHTLVHHYLCTVFHSIQSLILHAEPSPSQDTHAHLPWPLTPLVDCQHMLMFTLSCLGSDIPQTELPPCGIVFLLSPGLWNPRWGLAFSTLPSLVFCWHSAMGLFDFSLSTITGVDAHLALQNSVALVLTWPGWGMGVFDTQKCYYSFINEIRKIQIQQKQMIIYEGQILYCCCESLTRIWGVKRFT